MINSKISRLEANTWISLLSPVFIITIGHLFARFSKGLLGQWAWIGYFPVYWGMLLFFIFILNNKKNPLLWFKKSQGSYWWTFLAIGIGLISFPALFIPNYKVMNSVSLIMVWFSFALVNSPIEEAYWRAFLLDKTKYLPRMFGVIYSTVLFTAIHPLNLGVFSNIQAFNPSKPFMLLPFLLILIMLSLVYCLIYIKTKSLRLPVLSHILTDLGNLSIFLFMNMIQI
jgi:membrane protease YdiL (CAAX protease family)